MCSVFLVGWHHREPKRRRLLCTRPQRTERGKTASINMAMVWNTTHTSAGMMEPWITVVTLTDSMIFSLFFLHERRLRPITPGYSSGAWTFSGFLEGKFSFIFLRGIASSSSSPCVYIVTGYTRLDVSSFSSSSFLYALLQRALDGFWLRWWPSAFFLVVKPIRNERVVLLPSSEVNEQR